MGKMLKASHFSTLHDSTMSVVVSTFPSLCSFFSFDPLRPMSARKTVNTQQMNSPSVPLQADWPTCRKNPEEPYSKKETRASLSVCEQTTVQTRANRQDETPWPISIRPPPRTCSFAICSTSQHWRPRQVTASLPLALSPVRAVQLVGTRNRVIQKRLERSILPCQNAPLRPHLQS